MKNSVGKGAIILIISGFICKLFGAFFRLPLTNILGVEGIGVFQLVMSLYSLLLVFTTGGVTTALSRLVSAARARGEVKKVQSVVWAAIIFTLSLSFVLGVIIFLFGRPIASMQGATSAGLAYKLFIILLPIVALIGILRGIVQGYENMTPTAISQIIEQIIKFAFGLILAYFLSARGVAWGVFGAFLGIALSEVLALAYLLFFIKRKDVLGFAKPQYKPFFEAALPLTLSGAVVPATHAIDALIVVPLLVSAGIESGRATALFGLQTGVVGAILNFPLIISLSVAMAILPKISFLTTAKQKEQQQKLISNSFSLMWVFLLPLAFGLMAISPVLYPIIYPRVINGFLSEAITLTMLGGVSIILTAIMQFLLAVLQARGLYNFSFIATLSGGIIKILIVVLFARLKHVGIYALPLSNIALAAIVCVFGLIKLGNLVKIDIFEVILPLLAALIMFMGVWAFIKYSPLSPLLNLIFAVAIGGLIYICLLLPLVKEYISKIFKRKTVECENEAK